MKVERQHNADFLNRVVNDPAVRPDVAGEEEGVLDLSFAVNNVNNVLLCGEHGCIFFIRLLPGIYECHTQVLPQGRGKWVYRFTRECGVWMYTKTDAFEIATRIPEKHNAARHLAIMAGMRREFTRPLETVWRNDRQNVDIYSYRLQEWCSAAREMDSVGTAFHDFLHAEAARLKITTTPHADDPQHNRYVGCAIAMLESGQVAKGITIYNRWALLSRHSPIFLRSTEPVRITFDIGDLIFEDGAYRVERLEQAA